MKRTVKSEYSDNKRILKIMEGYTYVKNKITFFIVVLFVAAMTYITTYGLKFYIGDSIVDIKGSNQMRFGIDIRGGVDAVYEPLNLDRKPTDQELTQARTIIESRLDAKNILDRDVTIDKQKG